MVKTIAVLIVSAMLAAAFFGCSDETVVPTTNVQSNTTGVVRGVIDAGGAAFEYVIRPQSADPLVGPFVLRGNNVHYVDSLSALSVDLTIENQGEVSHPLPIGLTFVDFLPEDVTVENPDNDEHGPGAAILFEFENGDNEWTPGEKSLPRQVEFGVDAGVSIGFVAYIDIPQDTTSGTIGGIVWNDLNEDGNLDAEEPGIGGMTVYLISGHEPDVTPANADLKWSTITAPDGSYRFEDLDAGFYQVIRDFMDPEWAPTTSTVIYVTLVEQDGVVSDFMLANFGCVAQEVPPLPAEIEVGDYVKVNGDFADDPENMVVAQSIEVVKCETPQPPDTMLSLVGANHDWDNWDDDRDDDYGDCDCKYNDCDGYHDYLCWGLKNELLGPVTDVNCDEWAIEIMGTWVYFAKQDTIPVDSILVSRTDVASSGGCGWCPWLQCEAVEIGDRVRVRVFQHPDDGKLYALRLKDWNGTPDKVYGKVEEISESGDVLRVLGVRVDIADDTNICFHD
jgi:hypothetical protein